MQVFILSFYKICLFLIEGQLVCIIVFVSAIHLYFSILLMSVASIVSFLLSFILAMYLCSFLFWLEVCQIYWFSICFCFIDFHSVSLPVSLCTLSLFLPFSFFSLCTDTLYSFIDLCSFLSFAYFEYYSLFFF